MICRFRQVFCAKGPEHLASSIYPALLRWYDAHARAFPWRTPPRTARIAQARPDPYHVWVSEIMLQQTTTAHVRNHFLRFMAAFPNKEALAAAPEDEIMRLWAGLGYYARARHLHACAKRLAGQAFPEKEAQWRALPGIGAYTAAAIMAIGFDRAAVPVDANIARIVCRVQAIADRRDKTAMRAGAARLLGLEAIADGEYVPRLGDRVQALMDLGASLCTARKAQCEACPLLPDCKTGQSGCWSSFPAPIPRKSRPTRYGAAFALIDDGHVWVRRRPPKALLGGMLELPGSPWEQAKMPDNAASHWLRHAPCEAFWEHAGQITHIFTHFRLELEVFRALGSHPDGAQCVSSEALQEGGLASLFVKAAQCAFGR